MLDQKSRHSYAKPRVGSVINGRRLEWCFSCVIQGWGFRATPGLRSRPGVPEIVAG